MKWQSRLTHYFDEYTTGLGEFLESGTRRPISIPRMGRFVNRFIGKNQFLFHESKLVHQSVPYPQKYPPFTLRSTSNHENLPPFRSNPL